MKISVRVREKPDKPEEAIEIRLWGDNGTDLISVIRYPGKKVAYELPEKILAVYNQDNRRVFWILCPEIPEFMN